MIRITKRLALIITLCTISGAVGACGHSAEPDLLGFLPPFSRIVDMSGYYPYVESVSIPEKLLDSEAVEIELTIYLPETAPRPLYF